MSFGNLQKMAAQMQRDMARVEEELHAARLEGSAGGGVVRAVVSGKQELVSSSTSIPTQSIRPTSRCSRISWSPP